MHNRFMLLLFTFVVGFVIYGALTYEPATGNAITGGASTDHYIGGGASGGDGGGAGGDIVYTGSVWEKPRYIPAMHQDTPIGTYDRKDGKVYSCVTDVSGASMGICPDWDAMKNGTDIPGDLCMYNGTFECIPWFEFLSQSSNESD